MSPKNSVLAFFTVLFLSTLSFAAGGGHAADEKCGGTETEKAACHDDGHAAKGHGDKANHAFILNSLFPEKQKNPEKSSVPGLGELKTPAFMSTQNAGTINLTWTPFPGAPEYHLQIAEDPNFKWIVVNEKFLKEPSYAFTKAEAGKRYFWRVAGFKGDNKASYTKSAFVSSNFKVK